MVQKTVISRHGEGSPHCTQFTFNLEESPHCIFVFHDTDYSVFNVRHDILLQSSSMLDTTLSSIHPHRKLNSVPFVPLKLDFAFCYVYYKSLKPNSVDCYQLTAHSALFICNSRRNILLPAPYVRLNMLLLSMNSLRHSPLHL